MVLLVGGKDVVVVASDVELREHGLRGWLGGCAWKRQRERARVVERAHLVGKLLAECGAAIHFKFRNLVADSPDHDRRMIAVPQHHRRNILLPPFIEVAAVIELDLVRLPHVERLIENQQAEAVARVQERGRRRVVRRAHRIHARRPSAARPCAPPRDQTPRRREARCRDERCRRSA